MANDIWNDTRLPALTGKAAETDNFQLILAQIPSRFGYDDKATYLGFRSIGMTPAQAMEVACGGNLELLAIWQEEDPQSAAFETSYIVELQPFVGPEIVRLGFL